MNDDIVARLVSRDPGNVVVAALEELLAKDGELLKLDANERSICYRLAMYLQARIPNLHVDCEYNRDGIDPKKIKFFDLYPDQDDTEAKTVFPDIIIHRRNSKENYLVIEVKKSTNKTCRSIDYAKLRGYKSTLKFKFALFLEFMTGVDPGVSFADWIDN